MKPFHTLRVAGAAVALSLLSAPAALAVGSVNWLTPPNGSSAPVGTMVMPTGQASGGITGGVGLDLALVLDESGSMSGGSRVQDQRAAAIALIESVPRATSSIGIVGFGSRSSGFTTSILAPLQSATNQTDLIAAVNGTVADGGTPTDLGISEGAAMLRADDNGRAKQMVVITDGVPNSTTAAINAAAAAAAGTPAVQVNTVGLPNTSFGNQQAIANAGGGVFVTASNIQDLIDIFDGTGGNLVGIDTIDVTLPDGTFLSDIGLTSGLGDFKVPTAYNLALGANTWMVTANFDDGSSATANLTVFGTPSGVVPLPAAGWLLIGGLGALGALGRRRRG